jgi:hypothetical protein
MTMQRDKEKDLAALAGAFFDCLQIDNCEFGGIGLDCKRPFGNSDAEGDMLEILGADQEDPSEGWSMEQRDYVYSLYHNELIPYLRKQWASQGKEVKP